MGPPQKYFTTKFFSLTHTIYCACIADYKQLIPYNVATKEVI